MEDNKKVKNKIIALSGQPVTGKGTTVKAIVKKLEEQGYASENIHVLTTGHEFRNYFNAISEFIKKSDNSIELKELSQNPYLKKISENKEYREILIDTISQLKQNKVDTSNIDIEQANNLKEFSSIRKIVDTLIDTGIEEEGKRINQESKPDEIWIVDSRLAFHNIPEAFSVRLTCTPEIAGERLFNDKSRGEEDNNYKTIEEAIEAREKRRIGEQKRYKKRYDVDLENEDNYDLIIDTSHSATNDISDTILTCLDCYINDKPFAQKWTSPKTLLPMQGELATLAKEEYYFDELLAIIEKNGYIPSKAVEIIEVDGYKYIIEGHHRNFCSAYLGKTLVPYKVLAKNDENMPRIYSGGTARNKANYINKRYLTEHEQFFEHNTSEKFSYNDIYSGIYKKLEEKEQQGFEH